MPNRMSSEFNQQTSQDYVSSNESINKPPAVLDLTEVTPFRDTMRGGVGVYFAQRRYCRDLITARLQTQLDVEKNRLAVAALATKALDQKVFTKFINALWLELQANLGQAVDATEAEMRSHIESIVYNSHSAIKKYQGLNESGELPPAWRDRLVHREESRTDRLIDKLDKVLDELIEQRVKLMMGGISIPHLDGKAG